MSPARDTFASASTYAEFALLYPADACVKAELEFVNADHAIVSALFASSYAADA